MAPLLEVKNLSKFFKTKNPNLFGKRKYLKAVDRVSFTLEKKETIGIVGESGCGKSTLARLLLRLLEPSQGSLYFQGKDLTRSSGKDLKSLRRNMQMIFQDPYASLNPRMTIYEILKEPLDFHEVGSQRNRLGLIISGLERVGLSESILNRYPHEFSGGQRQRVGIARALSLSPQLIVADEPVSALDVSVQAQILNLIGNLKNDLGISFVFIAHDLSVIRHVSDKIAVMYLGEIVEYGPSDLIFSQPQHPYTRALLDSVPKIRVKNEFQTLPLSLDGEIPSPTERPIGCNLSSRCPYADEKCRAIRPDLESYLGNSDRHLVRCHYPGVFKKNVQI